MANVFEYIDYRAFVRDLISSSKPKKGYQAELARVMGCQAAYLSQVLREKAEFTEDHSIKLVQYLSLSEMESEYFMTLVRASRAGTTELRAYLENKREQLKYQSQELKNHVDAKTAFESESFATRYFASWIPLSVHIATSSKNYQTVEQISERFQLSSKTVKETLLFLEQAGLVVQENESWKFFGGSVHLPKKSPMNEIHQVNCRLQSIKAIQARQVEDLNFFSTFTIDPKGFSELKKILTETIEKSQKLIHKSGTDEVYSLSIDLFKN
jgi:uncharacterized protein (TIGR02147 family)